MLVVIVTDNGFAAEAIRRGFRGTSGVRVAGYVDGRRACGAAVAEARPDVVIVDEMTWSANAVARIGEVRRAVPAAKIIVLTAEPDAAWLADAVRAGADAAIAKTVQPTTLGLLVREIWAGTIHHAFASRRVTPERRRRPRQAHAARAGDPPARRQRRFQRPDRAPALGHRADGQVPPLERLPQARRREPDGSERTTRISTASSRRHRGSRRSRIDTPPDHPNTEGHISDATTALNAAPSARGRDPDVREPPSKPPEPVCSRVTSGARPASMTTPSPAASSRGPSPAPSRATRTRSASSTSATPTTSTATWRSLLRDDHEAEDVTQHVFAKLMTNLHKYEPREVPFSAWILRVARNVAVDHMRQRRAIPCEEVRERRSTSPTTTARCARHR